MTTAFSSYKVIVMGSYECQWFHLSHQLVENSEPSKMMWASVMTFCEQLYIACTKSKKKKNNNKKKTADKTW